jgi:hypothetical protein
MTAKALLAATPGAHIEPIEGGWRDFFHNEPIPDIHVRKFRKALLKTKALHFFGRTDLSGRGFLRGKFALAKPSPSHIVSGGQAEGGAGENGAGW